MQNDQRQILTVSQLNRRTRQLLETHLPLLWVEGEISNFVRPASGHWYFSLKDEQAQVRCAMFRNRNGLVRFQPANGTQVLVRCRVSLYEGRGEFQLIVEHMEEAGFGALQRRFEALKTKLADEGLFADEHKRLPPPMPQRIGVVTSPTGAAIRDILTVLQRRFPAIPVTIYPTSVQGNEAIEEIARAIETANRHNTCDVLIVGRGGGSIEDLWAFNEERVARAIYASHIPIVSAVGHEVDFTIADFVADMRAPTPSAAAELLTPDQRELAASFSGYQQLLRDALARRVSQIRQRLEFLGKRLRHPGQRLREQAQHLDHLEMRLQSALRSQLHHHRARLNDLVGQLSRYHPEITVRQLTRQTETLHHRLQSALRNQLRLSNQRLANAAQLLHAVSPLNTLKRGYAIVQDDAGHIVKHGKQVAPGQKITSRISDSTLHCLVEKIVETR